MVVERSRVGVPLARLRPLRIRAGGVALRSLRAAVARVPPVAAGLAASIPVISSTVKAVHAGWMPAGDDGIIATRGWDVLSSHTPLVGQYSEAGLVIRGQVMHSPGPMLYWLIALPARFGSVASIPVAICIANTLAIVGCVVLARRRGGLVLMFAVAAGIALMCQSLAGEVLHDIWNPAAALFPFLFLVFLCWSLSCGERRLLPLVALVASFVVQTHLTYAAPTAVLLAVGVGGLALRRLAQRRASSRPPRIWPWALAALVVAAACWTAPAIDEIENTPGNLTMIVRTAEHREPKLGASVGWHAVVRSIGVRPWWLYVPASEWEHKTDVRETPSEQRVDTTIALLAALALVGLLGGLARRFDVLAASLIGLGLSGALVLQAASNPSTRLLAGTLAYTTWWGSELGLFVWLTLAWALWLTVLALARRIAPALRARAPSRAAAVGAPARAAAIALASLASLGGVVGIGFAVAADAKPDSHGYEYRAIARIGRALERVVPSHATVAYHLGPLDPGTQPMEPAIRFLLVRRGDRVLADGSFPRLGSYYEQGDRPYQWVVYVTDAKLRKPPGMWLVVRVRFNGPWGPETMSAWVRRARPGERAHSVAHRRTHAARS